MIWKLIVGALIGSIGGALTKKGGQGCLANILAGIAGSYVGHALLGDWGPSLAGMALVPSIIGAALVTIVVAHFLGRD
ncbi:GlsB/YeaQ/YmgE family stress response membrane protein [Streptococcus entericus]|uniref:GlsB/YeaQ/YmgE family stress response membrane protein n=1 Tax=Streptococcus entericus TaxID=155680 RepID=UPI000360157E|nr:GlsB/YeaQ/YmgE family stress response membrane protein [Streptococcus entericus]